MSTPNPTHIIAEHVYVFERWQCVCGWSGARKDHAAHVVSKLTDAGYSIVTSEWLTKHTTTVSGWRIGQTVQVNFDGCKPFTATLLNEDPPNRIEVRDENGDVMFVHASIVTAAAAEGEKP